MRKKENPRNKDEYQIKMLSKSVELSYDAIITTSRDGIITSWNKGAERILGYSANEILRKSVSILEPPFLIEEIEELTELIKSEEEIHSYETFWLRKDGKIITIRLSLSSIFDDSHHLIAILFIARDITWTKQTEEKLRKSEEIYNFVIKQTGQVMYECDLKTYKCKWAGAIEEVTGYSFEELEKLGKYFWITNIEPLNLISTTMHSFDTLMTGDRFKEELRLKRKDRTYIYIENQGTCLKDNNGHPYKIIGVIKNITDLKIALEKIEESEEKYKSFVQNFHGIFFQFDENSVPIFLGGAVEEITGYREENFMSQIAWEDIIHLADRFLVLNEKEKVRNLLTSGFRNIEYRIRHRNGRTIWINEVYQKIHRGNGKPDFYQSTIYDVTERKETETFLANIDIARKQEIHHRIKNNLQVISSLLDLQAEKFSDRKGIQDSEVLEAFKESQNRVISMALIHEELYKGDGLDTLNFSSYIEELVDNLFLTYRLENTAVSLNMDLEEDILFDMDTAIPLGIIVNELISNSLKYAFVGRDEGEIRVKLSRRKESQKIYRQERENKNDDCKSASFTLTVSDNGVGIPELDFEDLNSFGLQLVTTLVDQLDGELELKRDNGTEFIIRFTVTEKKESIVRSIFTIS